MISFQLYYIVNVAQFLIRNMNLMLKFTSYPQFIVDKYVSYCFSMYLRINLFNVVFSSSFPLSSICP